MLQRLGIPVERSLPSETADGRIVPVDVGEATIRLEGLQFHTAVIFAEENEPSLLGVVSLEQAALGVDPLGGKTDTRQPATPLANSPPPRLKTAGHRSCFSDGSRTKTTAGQQTCATAPEPL